MSDTAEKKVTVELKDIEPADKETELTLNELSGVSGGVHATTFYTPPGKAQWLSDNPVNPVTK